MKKMLIIRPDYDIGTNYLFKWSQKVIDVAEEKGWKTEKSDSEKATRKEFESRLKNRPDFVFINGHGNNELVVGHDSQPLADAKNCSMLKNTITFTRACNCLNSLGKKAVKKGCIAFIGYNKEFWIPRSHKFEAVPLKDPLAKPVIETSNIVPISIIKGNTIENSIANATSIAEKHILKLLISSEQQDRATLKAIINNMGALGFEGDAKAKID